jgi:hypothetical protein
MLTGTAEVGGDKLQVAENQQLKCQA